MLARSSPITVGRDAELERIDHAREAAGLGRPTIVLVRGEAGIGKSRLVRDATERARAAGSAVLHGSCLDLDGDGLPYLPFVEAFRSLARSTPRDRLAAILGPARADLAVLIPELGDPAGGAPDPAGGAPGSGDGGPAGSTALSVDRSRLFERVLGVVGRLGAEAPLVAVLEDVQWIDPATRDLVTFLVRNVTTERLVAILTCRTDDLAPGHPVLAWMAELGRAPGAVRIDVGRLTRDEVRRQLEAMAGGPVDDELAGAIWRRSEGHPLFAEELLAATGEADGEGHPPSLVDVLLARVATLAPDTLTLIRVLAVVGRPVDERLIARLAGGSAGEVGGRLREAIARGVLTALPEGRYGFRHELLREVVEHDLSAGERRELHGAIAAELTAHPELGDDRPAGATAELARHWAAADLPDEAHAASLRAAAAAEEVHAFADAHRQLERAIGLEPRLDPASRPSLAERIEVRQRASTAADLSGAWERAVELARDALALDPAVDPTTAGLLHARLAFLTWAGGEGEAALEEHRRAVDLVPALPPTRERAHVLGGLGGALMGLGRWAESRVVCEAAIDCAVRSGATAEESRARTMLGSDLVALGELEAGLDELRRSHALAGTGPTELFIVTGHNLGLNLLAADRLDEALAAATAARAAARDGGMERRFGMELAALAGDVLLRLGRWDEADAVTSDGLALARRDFRMGYLSAVRARLVARRGDPPAARQLLDGIDPARLDPDLAIFIAIVGAEVAGLDGRPDDALRIVADAVEAFGPTLDVLWGVPLVTFGLRAAAELAEAARAAQDEARLEAVRTRTAYLRDLAGLLSDQVITAGGAAWLATAAAETARLDGRVDPGPWERAIAAWDEAVDAAELAHARFRAAETALRRSGVKADVGSDLRAAWQSARELGAAGLRSSIETLARRARIDLAADRAADETDGSGAGPAGSGATSEPGGRSALPSHTLSAREIEVLRLVAAGRSNGEIGDELFITRKTAGVHVTHILDKLGVSNRVEAAMAAARLGLIEPEGPVAGEGRGR